MDFELTEEQKKIKQEVCDFLDKEVTKEVMEESELGMGYGPQRKLGAKKWLAPSIFKVWN